MFADARAQCTLLTVLVFGCTPDPLADNREAYESVCMMGQATPLPGEQAHVIIQADFPEVVGADPAQNAPISVTMARVDPEDRDEQFIGLRMVPADDGLTLDGIEGYVTLANGLRSDLPVERMDDAVHIDNDDPNDFVLFGYVPGCATYVLSARPAALEAGEHQVRLEVFHKADPNGAPEVVDRHVITLRGE